MDGKSSNITINVTYIDSNSRVGKISYVDSTTGTEVGNAPISGKIGSTISITDTINKNVPKDYEIASGQNIPKTVTVTDSGIETVVVKVEKTATGKISYVDSTTNKEVGSATITGKVGHTISIIDTVNNNIPKDYELVPGQTIPTVDVTENGISTVNIKVQKKTVTGKISYIDVDANDKEVQTTDLSAKAGETVRISTSIPENYELVSDQNIPTEVTATSSGIPTVTVKIKHKTQDVSDTDPGAHQARTITEYYKYADAGSLTGQEVFSEDQLQVFYKGTAIKDLVTGKVTYSNWKWDTSQGDEDTPGFHVVKGTWTGLGEKGKPSTKSIVINPPDKEEYTAITGTRVNYNTNVFVNPNTDFTTDTASKWYYRNSLTTYYVPKTLVDKMISRTIYVTEPGKEQASVTNNVNVTRYAAINSTDTGVIYEGFEGSGWQITGTNSWPAYTVPSHPGYTVKITKSIDGGAEEAGSEADLAQKTVTVDGKSEVINITYSATSTISLDGSGSSEYTGQPITIDDVNKGITVNVIGPDSTTSGKYTLVDGDVEFLKDGSTGSYSTTLPTDAGKYSMKLTEAGMNHIKTKFGNNAITFQYADNKDVAYYTIAQVKAEVSLTGSKTITYGDAVKIDASNYQLKATDSQGNSIDTTGIKLTDGDLEFVTTPTDAGTYQVKLTTQGIDKLKALKGAANYNWDSASDARANYIVEKKSLVYSILGIVNSQYTGSPITIADLTSHGSIIHVQVQSNDYALVDGDVQFAKHGTHDYSTIYPTEIGRYDVQLTEAGVRHLQEKYGDRNTKLTPVKQEQVATYIIEQGTAKVSLSGDQTVAYNEDKTIDPSKYTLSIKNSNGDTIFANETLAAGDLEFVNTPTEPGNYQVKLSQQGIAKLKALSDSYNWDSASEARANYQATGATSKINLINNVSVPYTGNPVTFDEIGSRVKVNIAGPDNATSGTYNLVAGDIQIAKAGTSDFSTTYPTEAGQYVVKLTEAGLKHIKNHFGNNYITYQYNENIPHSDWTTLTIEQAKANVSLTGGQSSYYSQEAKIDAGKYQVSIKDDQGNALFAGKITLADGDLEFDTTPTNVGTYQVKLTSQGLNKVKALSTNYSWDSAAKATATYTVEAMPVNVTVEGGNKSVKYGSQDWVDNFIDDPKTPEDIGYTLSLKTKDGKDLDTSSVSGNLTWQNDTTPTNAGEYHLSVDTSAIQQKLGSNYQVIDKVDNSLTFTIEKGNATITLVNKYDDGKTYDGQDGTIDATNYTYTVITDGADPDRIYSINDFSTVDNIELTDDYLQLVPINGNIKDAGTYEVKLTSAGEQAIKNTDASDDLTTGTTLYGSNYNWTFAPSEATYKIAKTTAMATVNGQVSKTYDGTAISNYTPSVDINVSGVGDTTNNIELTAGTDYVWKLGNQTFTTAPVNTGDYTIELTDSGKNKIMAFDANNVDWDDAGSSITSAATYTITQAAASATLSGQGTRAYNGQGVTLADLNAKDANNNITLTIKYPANGDANHSETIALTADDFVWNTTDGKAPVDANSQAYTISLNTAAIKKLIEDKAGYSTDASGKKISNVTVNDTAVSGTAEYTITPLETAAIVAGYGDYGKEYDATTTDSIDPSKLKFTAKVGDQTVDLDTTGLTGDDFEWVDQNGAALTEKPKNVGTYYIKLTNDGLTKLNNQNTNFKLTSQSGTGTYIITQGTASAKLDGTGSKFYNGSKISASDLDNGSIKVALTFPGSNSASYTLQDGDYVLDKTNDGSVGKYTITLTDAGKKHIQDKIAELSGHSLDGTTSNVTTALDTITGSASYEIKAAENTVSVSGTQTETYTGQTITPKYDSTGSNGVKVTIIANNGKAVDITNAGLTGSDFKTVDASGNDVNAVNANGTYHIVLTDEGLARLQRAVGNNYQLSKGTSFGTLIINKATGTASFEGSASYVYTGNPVDASDYLSQYTLKLNEPNNPTYQLVNGDVEFKQAYGTWSTNVPTKVGKYDVRLSQQGWDNVKKINSDNVQWSATASTTGKATFEITQASATATLSGSGSMIYTGQAAATDLSKDGSTIAVTIKSDGANIANLPETYELTGGDYTWNTGSAPTNVGNYTIALTNAGIQKIQAAIDQAVGAGNVVLKGTGSASFEIKQAVKTNVQLHGDVENTYNGNSVSFDPTANDQKDKFGFNNIEGLTMPTFASSDFDWYSDADGKNKLTGAPKDAGTYYLLLNDAGKKKIVDANKNYSFTDKENKSTITGAISYKINQADLAIKISGQSHKDYDGKNAVVSAADLTGGDIKVSWNDSSKMPTDLGSYTLTADDLEIVDASGNAVKKANAIGNVTTGNPVYTVRLKQSSLAAIEALSGAKNYKISTSTSATYLIYKQKAQLTLTGNQKTTYGNPLAFDPSKYTLDFSNWVDPDNTKPTKSEINLHDGDLYIVYGSNDGPTNELPTDVGTYQVAVSDQLLARLKAAYPNYDFDGITVKSSSDSKGDSTDDTHEPATYVIDPATTNVKINGTKKVKYGSSKVEGNYSLTITATVNGVKDTKIFDGQVTLTNEDLEFADGTPGNVGDYHVKLSSTGLAKLANLSKSSTTGESNYDWSQAKEAKGLFMVEQMPVTITVNDANKLVVYGSQDWLDDIKKKPSELGYGLTITTKEGNKPLTYTLQAGDLEFAQTPGNVGDYQVQLSADGLSHIKSALGTNYDCPQSAEAVTSKGKFNVSQGSVEVKLTGNDGRPYDAKSTTTSNLDLTQYSYSATIYDASGNPQSVDLTADDLEIVPINSSTENVGEYTVQLSSHGQNRLKALDGNNGANYKWNFTTNAKYTIIAADAPTVKLSGQNSKTYDGHAVTIDEVNSSTGDIKVKFTYPGSNENSTYTLTTDDLDWYDENNQKLASAPTDAGKYTIKVKDSSLAKIKNRLTELAGTNVNADKLTSVSGSASFSITPKTINNVTVSGNDQSKTYDSQAANLDVSGLTVQAGTTSLNKETLDASDFDWYDANNKKLDTVPTDAGNYQARLKSEALQKLQAANKNYSFSSATGTINYQIKQAPVTAVIGGNDSRAYNGQSTSASDVLGKVTWTPTGLVSEQNLDTSAITADDYEWFAKNADGTETVMTGNPTNAGSYVLKFKSSGIDKLRNANKNYSFADNAVSGEFTYTINKATENISADLSGSNHREYNGSAVTNDDVISTSGDITVKLTYPGSTDQSTYTLQDGDYKWFDEAGNALSGAPTNVGKYKIKLTSAGLTRLQDRLNSLAGGENVTISESGLKGDANFEITKKALTVSLGDKDSTKPAGKTYDGNAGVINPNDGKFTSEGLASGDSLNISGLTKGDFDWVDENGNKLSEVPTNAGTYYIALNSDGLTKLQNKNPNYQVNENGKFKYVISPAEATITVSGNQESTTAEINNDQFTTTGSTGITIPTGLTYEFTNGKPSESGTYDVQLTKDSQDAIKNANKNYSLTFTSTAKFQLDQTLKIVFKDKDDKNKQVGETITKNGVAGSKIENLNLTIPEKYELAQNQTLPKDYTFTKPLTNTITIYLAHKKTNVDPNDSSTNPDSTNPNWFKDNGLVKEITRTINYQGLSESQLAEIPADQKKQTVEFTRTAKYDEVTGKIVAGSEGEWVVRGNNNFTGFTPKNFAGYTTNTDKVEEATPKADDKDSTITISYTKNAEPVTPDVPGTPDEPTTPGKPDDDQEILEDLIFVDGTGNVIARLPKLIFGKKGTEWSVEQVSALIKKYLPKGWVLPTNFSAKKIQINGLSAFVTLMLPGENWTWEVVPNTPRSKLGTVIYFMDAQNNVITNVTAYWSKRGATAKQVKDFAQAHMPAGYDFAPDWQAKATTDRPTAQIVKIQKKAAKKIAHHTSKDTAFKKSDAAPLGLILTGLGMLGLGGAHRRKHDRD